MIRRTRILSLLALALPLGTGLATASIERLTLRQMVAKADAGVFGEIVGRQVTAVATDDGSGDLYFTTLTVAGRPVEGGDEVTVSVSYPGGFVDAERGVFNSEAPAEDDVQVGRQVLVFYKWSDDMGGGFAANALYASHGGLFRTFQSKKGVRIVQGRGAGYAVSENLTLATLESEVRDHLADLRKR